MQCVLGWRGLSKEHAPHHEQTITSHNRHFNAVFSILCLVVCIPSTYIVHHTHCFLHSVHPSMLIDLSGTRDSLLTICITHVTLDPTSYCYFHSITPSLSLLSLFTSEVSATTVHHSVQVERRVKVG